MVHWLISWYALVASVASSLCHLFQGLGNLLRGELGACPCTDVETWAKRDEVTGVKAHVTRKQPEQSRCHEQLGDG